MTEPEIDETPTCPNCKSIDRVAKVSKIVLEDSEAFRAAQPSEIKEISWAGRSYYLPASEKWTGIPARQLLPWMLFEEADKPENSSRKLSLKLVGPFVLFAILSGLLLFAGISTDILVLTIVAALGLIVSIFYVGFMTFIVLFVKGLQKFNDETNEQYRQNLNRIEVAEARWNKFYFCYRCDRVFTREGHFFTVPQMQKYLFEINLE